MKKNIQEMILLYNFTDELRLMEIKTLLEAMKIKVITVDKEEHYQKIDWLDYDSTYKWFLIMSFVNVNKNLKNIQYLICFLVGINIKKLPAEFI